jgi:hypothetical protein
MIKLCNYSHIFGTIGEGIHSYRLFNIAIVDVLLTIIVAYYLHKYIFINQSFLCMTTLLFILGILLHRLFCVRTTIDKILFN